MADEIVANSWNGFLAEVKAAKATLREPEQVWFRG